MNSKFQRKLCVKKIRTHDVASDTPNAYKTIVLENNDDRARVLHTFFSLAERSKPALSGLPLVGIVALGLSFLT